MTTFYATLGFPTGEVCLAIPARDMMDAVAHLAAWTAGYASGSDGRVPEQRTIDWKKPRGLEAQPITSFVRLP